MKRFLINCLLMSYASIVYADWVAVSSHRPGTYSKPTQEAAERMPASLTNQAVLSETTATQTHLDVTWIDDKTESADKDPLAQETDSLNELIRQLKKALMDDLVRGAQTKSPMTYDPRTNLADDCKIAAHLYRLNTLAQAGAPLKGDAAAYLKKQSALANAVNDLQKKVAAKQEEYDQLKIDPAKLMVTLNDDYSKKSDDKQFEERAAIRALLNNGNAALKNGAFFTNIPDAKARLQDQCGIDSRFEGLKDGKYVFIEQRYDGMPLKFRINPSGSFADLPDWISSK